MRLPADCDFYPAQWRALGVPALEAVCRRLGRVRMTDPLGTVMRATIDLWGAARVRGECLAYGIPPEARGQPNRSGLLAHWASPNFVENRPERMLLSMDARRNILSWANFQEILPPIVPVAPAVVPDAIPAVGILPRLVI